ncbi:hypothetical protein FHX37_3093 [Haloactinospora alba]|uniref:Voltage-gated potassium channel n=1 Tax=Haloactinospora alba TaxID=405555 RepID=A0A543NMQ4_9ACTN|nr:ion transporter [Haloactinospora alba]TQN33094.1 hypothetical protein FHX37_3093 [Haloactinospora alba]
MPDTVTEINARARRLERGLAVPVLVAAVASVPALFLTVWGSGAASALGRAANWLVSAVLWAEWLVLFLMADSRLRWIRDHKWTTFVACATVPAVIFLIGPVQVLRFLQVLGALRVVRVTRILKAGRVLRRRADLPRTWQRVVMTGSVLLSAGFVAVVLADPTARSRLLLADLLGWAGVWPPLVAAVLLFAATVVVLRAQEQGPLPP